MASVTDPRTLAAAAVLAAVAVASACASSTDATDGASAPAGPDGGASACPPCVTDDDCGGAKCVQIGADSVCAPACDPTSNACSADRTCTPASNVAGEQVSVCVPTSGECTAGVPSDDGGAPASGCPGLASPTTQATCTSCSGKSSCQPNGCYGGWWCNLASSKCQAPPTSCGSSGGTFDGGAPVGGSVGPTGGKLTRLYFSVVGDTRPPAPDDTSAYPTAIITKIYDDIQNLSPRPPFSVSTGDYMFARTGSSQAAPQLDIYLGARAKFSGAFFPAMGNHECTGGVASNCGAGNTDGVTTQFDAFLQKMLGPVQQSQPYYSIRIDAQDGSWTSKFVFVAANAWSDAQASWLDAELSKPTTYTFFVRHESKYATEAPGVRPSEAILANHPYTLSLVGHTHTYEHFSGSKEVIVGNGGAPLTGSKNYGFAVLQQRADGAIQVDMLDYATTSPDPAFRFAVKPDGTQAP